MDHTFSGRRTRRPETWLVVVPYQRQCGPPALVPTLPPIVEIFLARGIGRVEDAVRAAIARERSRLINPG